MSAFAKSRHSRAAGAGILVIGRPITADPAAAARAIAEELGL
jgi:orotidine-5'-phosphate decarboxylase